MVHPEQSVKQAARAVTIRAGEARTPKPVEPRRPRVKYQTMDNELFTQLNFKCALVLPLLELGSMYFLLGLERSSELRGLDYFKEMPNF